MNKEQFLIKLAQGLKSLPNKDIDEAIEYYSEIIQDRIDEDLSEEEAIIDLGDINIIIDSILNSSEKNNISNINEAEDIRMKANKEMIVNKELSTTKIIITILLFPFWFPLLAVIASLTFVVYAIIWSLTLVYYISLVTLPIYAITALIGSVTILAKGDAVSAASLFSSLLMNSGLFLILLAGARYTFKFSINLSRKIWSKIRFIINKGVNIYEKGN